MSCKGKRTGVSRLASLVPVRYRNVSGEQIKIFIARHAAIGFLTGVGSTVGAIFIQAMIG